MGQLQCPCRFILPLYDESLGFKELLPQLLHDHLFAGLLVDTGLTAVLVAAVAGSRTSCGKNLHFELLMIREETLRHDLVLRLTNKVLPSA